jgi:Putative DNA-binding domain
MYTPFEKHITDLSAPDLEVLQDIPEGWFIEYKKEPCKSKDYAKEVSAFANAYGGWIFVGLEEDNSSGKPLGGPGIPLADARRLEDAARDAITQNCSPAPFFELRIVEGPIVGLSISADKCVLILRVPQSENTPHIHCSGKVYLRQADKAEPKAISERGELDRLYERCEKLHKRTLSDLKRGFDENWIKDFKLPWFHLALVPNLSGASIPKTVSFQQFHDIVSKTGVNSVELPDIYSSALGFVARNHSQQQDPTGPATTLEYDYFTGSIFITIPFSAGIAIEEQPNEFLRRSPIGREFAMILKRKGFSHTQIFDGSHLFWAMAGLYRQVSDLLSIAKMGRDYIGRIEMVNLFRLLPYFESSSYVQWCNNHTLPIIHRNQFSTPLNSDSWFTIDDMHNSSTIADITHYTIEALGIPPTLVEHIVNETLNLCS